MMGWEIQRKEAEKMTYETWYGQYLALYKRDLAEKTRESYDFVTTRYILPALGGLELADVTPEHLQTAINDAADRGGLRQAQVVYQLLHAVFRRACRSRLVLWSPADAIDKPDYDPEEGKALTDQDYDAALPHVAADLGLSLALFAGLRRGEICGLQWGDVDLQEGTLCVRRQRIRCHGQLITAPPKSAAGIRDIPIAPQLLPQLRKAYRLWPSAYVVDFSPETVSRRWRDIQQRDVALQMPYRLHDLRHTYGTRLILKGCNMRVVQYLMGHSTIDVTMRVYSHCRAADARAELQRVYIANLH